MLPVGTALGKLTMGQVFIDFEGPQLFSCTSEDGNQYLVVHVPSTDYQDQWLYVPITTARLAAVADGRITLRDAFIKPDGGLLHVVATSSDSIATATPILTDMVDKDWLPAAGERLSEPGLYDIIASTSNSFEAYEFTRTLGLPSFLGNPESMWEMSRRALDYLKSVRTPVAQFATASGRSVVDIVLKKGEYRTDLPASTLGRLLLSAQTVIDGLTPEYPVGAKNAELRNESRLDALAFFPSSFGIRLEAHTATLFTHPGLATALDRLVTLLKASDDTPTLRNLLIEYGPKAALRYRSFAEVLAKSEADLAVEVGVPGRGYSTTADIVSSQIGRLVEFLDVEIKQVTEPFTFRGDLVGFSLRTKFFRLEGMDKDYSGRIEDAFLPSMIGKTVGGRYDASITSITDLNESTGEERVRFLLTDLKEA